MTFDELFIQWQGHTLNAYDLSANIAKMHATKKTKPSDLNPYRKSLRSSQKTSEGFMKKPMFGLKV